MNLSKNFTLSELTKSQDALRHNIDNTPDAFIQKNLQLLCENVLQPIRDHFGPVTVSSGYRSKALNEAVGGSKISDHMSGCAADIEVSGISNKVVAEWVRDNLKTKQLILEFPGANPNDGWIHVSFDKDDLKCEVLTAKKIGGKTVYLPGLQ